jgi:hypothetical protein
MVALVAPEYFESKWCVAEWQAMEELETKRLGAGNHKLIIPVVHTGDMKELKKYIGTRQAAILDMRGLLSPLKQLNTYKNLELIANIAKTITKLVKQIPPPPTSIDCKAYSVFMGPDGPTGQVVEEPSPFVQ